MATTPRSTTALIDRTRQDLAQLQQPAEFWERMVSVNFADNYRQALTAAGVKDSKADEISAMVRQYINRISDGLQTATYLLRELASEVDEARRLARSPGWQEAQGFTV